MNKVKIHLVAPDDVVDLLVELAPLLERLRAAAGAATERELERAAVPMLNMAPTIGARIRQAREQSNLTLKEASRLIWGLNSTSRLSNYEQDLREPGAATIQHIARVFGKSPNDLMFGPLITGRGIVHKDGVAVKS